MRKVSFRKKSLVEKRCVCSFSKLIRMICVNKSLVVSSNLVGICLLVFRSHHYLACPLMMVEKSGFGIGLYVVLCYNLGGLRVSALVLIGCRSSVLGVRLMWIMWVCSLYVSVNIGWRHRGGIACICMLALCSIIVFGWCMLLVSVVSVKRIKSSGILWLNLMCSGVIVTII